MLCAGSLWGGGGRNINISLIRYPNFNPKTKTHLRTEFDSKKSIVAISMFVKKVYSYGVKLP